MFRERTQLVADTLTLGTADNATIVDLLSASFQTVRGPDDPNYSATLRNRQNAPAGTHQGILSYAERTSITQNYTVKCLGNAGVPSLQASRTSRDSIKSLLDTAQAYWVSPNHSQGALVLLTYQFGDMATADTFTVFRGEIREQHGIDAAIGYITIGLKLMTWDGTVS